MLKPYQCRLAAELLRMASDQFANHGCNDFDLSEHGLTKDEQLDFAQTAGRLNRETAEETRDRLRRLPWSVPDYEAMSVLADLIEEMASQPRETGEEESK